MEPSKPMSDERFHELRAYNWNLCQMDECLDEIERLRRENYHDSRDLRENKAQVIALEQETIDLEAQLAANKQQLASDYTKWLDLFCQDHLEGPVSDILHDKDHISNGARGSHCLLCRVEAAKERETVKDDILLVCQMCKGGIPLSLLIAYYWFHHPHGDNLVPCLAKPLRQKLEGLNEISQEAGCH